MNPFAEVSAVNHGGTLFALADPMRLRILEVLRDGGKPVGVLADGLPVSRPAVSQHLKVLKGAGLVREAKQGTRRVYTVEPKGLVALRRYLDTLWADALAAYRNEADAAPRPAPRRPRGGKRRAR